MTDLEAAMMQQSLIGNPEVTLSKIVFHDPFVDGLRAENERLRAGIQAYLNGDIPGPRDHRPGKCEHGTHYWEPCEQCIDAHFTRLLAGDDATSPR